MLSEGFEEIARQAERSGEQIQQILEVLAKQAVKPINDAAAQLTETTTQLSDIIGKFGSAIETVGTKLESIHSPEEVVRAQLAPAIIAIKEMAEVQLQPLRNIEQTLSRIADLPGRPLSAEPRSSDIPLASITGEVSSDAITSFSANENEPLTATRRKRRWHLW
jgi:ABC-type transporter Mla subunit MlaD